MLTQDRLKELTSYCPETGLFTWLERKYSEDQRDSSISAFNTRYSGKEAGTTITIRTNKYRNLYIDGSHTMAHRAAWLYFFGEFPENQIDHINGNGLDNRIDNLRDVTPAENSRNMKLSAKNKSGFNGVRWCKYSSKWVASIGFKGKTIVLGSFINLDEAIQARKSGNVKYGYHKNHGRLQSD